MNPKGLNSMLGPFLRDSVTEDGIGKKLNSKKRSCENPTLHKRGIHNRFIFFFFTAAS